MHNTEITILISDKIDCNKRQRKSLYHDKGAPANSKTQHL